MTNIFVGNLSYQTTEDDLRAAFQSYGAIERVSIITDRDTGQPRGFAFVEMANSAEAARPSTPSTAPSERPRHERQRSAPESGGWRRRWWKSRRRRWWPWWPRRIPLVV